MFKTSSPLYKGVLRAEILYLASTLLLVINGLHFQNSRRFLFFVFSQWFGYFEFLPLSFFLILVDFTYLDGSGWRQFGWCHSYRLGSRFWLYETSQIPECYSVQMQAVMKQKSWPMLRQMYLSMIQYPRHDWHAAFGHKRLCCKRATAGTFILILLYNDSGEKIFFSNSNTLKAFLKSLCACYIFVNSYNERIWAFKRLIGVL